MKEMINQKAMVLFSGGVDSSTCLAMAIQEFGPDQVIPLSVTYGQKHEKELEAAKKILEYYHLSGMELDLTTVFSQSSCSLLSHSDQAIPNASYAEQLSGNGGHPVSTYVPFRNGLFLSAAASMALSLGCSQVWYGAHMDDAAGNAYPDCSQTFFQAMAQAVWEGSGRQLTLKAPFISQTKAEIVKTGLSLGVPYDLTWSCYAGGKKPCGCCGTCIDRRKAFEANGISDPADRYAD